MLPVLAVFSSLALFRIHRPVDLCFIFRVEPIHVILTSVSKMFKKYLTNMFRADKRFPNILQNFKRGNKSYKQIRGNVLYSLNALLKETERISGGFELEMVL